MTAQRIDGMTFDEILHADDTICITQDEEAMNALLASIGTQGKRYGLRFNLKTVSFSASGRRVESNAKTGRP